MKKSFKSGFTLIELLVTIGIGLMILGGAIAGYISFEARRQVETQALEVQQMIISARGRASARVVPPNYLDIDDDTLACRNIADSRLAGYYVHISESSVQVSPACETSGNYLMLDSRPEATQVMWLRNGVDINEESPGGFGFTYYTLPRNGDLTSLSTDRTVSVTDGDVTYEFTITKSGGISRVTSQ